MASVYSVWNSTIESISQIPNYIRYPNPPKVERPDNSHCLFLAKLNPDIRIMIYKSVLAPLTYGCGAIHLKTETPGRGSFSTRKVGLWGKRCTSWTGNCEHTYGMECRDIRVKQLFPDFSLVKAYQRRLQRLRERRIDWWAMLGIKPKPDEFSEILSIYNSSYVVLGLLLSCRDVYTEALPVFYQYNVFTFVKPKTLLTLQQTLPTHNLRSIRFLHFSTTLDARWDSTNGTAIASDVQCHPDYKQFTIDVLTQWDSAWSIIANEMDGLQNLKVSFTPLCIPGARKVLVDETLLHVFWPMMNVHVPEFRVVFYSGYALDESRDELLDPGQAIQILELEAGRRAPFRAHVNIFPNIRAIVSNPTCMDWARGKLPCG